MKNLIFILSMLFLPNLSAQEYLTTSSTFDKYAPTEQNSISIMFQNTTPLSPNQNWKKGVVERRKRIITNSTIKGMLLGAIAASIIAYPLQKSLDEFITLFTWKEVDPRYEIIAISAVCGGAFGGRIGYINGKRKAEKLEYLEFMEKHTKKERGNRGGSY